MSAYGNPRSYGHADHDGYQSGRRPSNGVDGGEYDSYGSADSYGGYADPYAADSYGSDPYPADSYTQPAPRPPRAPNPGTARGGASAGRARVAASAAVAPPETTPAPESSGHRYDWASAGSQRSAGRASVPVSPAVGGVTARAAVRPPGLDKPDGPEQPGGPGGPGGPDRPAGGAGSRPGGSAKGKPKRKKKRVWIRNTLLIALAVMVITAGGGMVALSYYVDSVPPPELVALEEGSTVYYGDGKEMAVLQEVNREIIDTKVPELEHVREAVIAAEDKGFYDHSGVDFMGIMRAAWNNFTGGAQQGASTIDQQYVGGAADIRGENSYSRKMQEAAMAYKMNQDYDKDDILDFYLNTIYFGRGAHGIEAAAQAYFGKPAQELSVPEAAVLAGCIRMPDDGSTLCPYDPLHTPDDPTTAQLRLDYVLNQMVDMGALDPAERDGMELPEAIEPPDPDQPLKGPQGNIVRQVQEELEAMEIFDISTGGYRITTTIDRDLQQAARDAARRKNKGPLWEGMPDNIAASLVSIDPASGAVLAYYGGDDGSGIDFAGTNDEQFQSGRPPGSTMKIYTLIAAMREGVSFDSKWQTEPYTPGWAQDPIRNAGRGTATNCEGVAPDYCSLRWSTIQSYNVPFAYFSEAMGHEGPQKILQAAMDAGIRTITGTVYDEDGNQEAIEVDLTSIGDVSEVAPENFFHQIAFGQYPITALDHASGMATLAARGIYHEPHFVAKVEQKVNGEWETIRTDQISGEQRIQTEHADEITSVLSQIPNDPIMGGNGLANGRPAAAKTGTWEHPDGGNRDAWVVGYTPQIATSVWVGDPDNGQIKDQWGGDIGSSALPAQIWKQFMDTAHAEKGYEPVQFPPPPGIGDENHRFANGILPEPDDDDEDDNDDPRCRGPIQPFCPDDDGDDGNNGGGDNGGGGDQPNGGGILPPPPQPGQDPEQDPPLPPD